MGEGHALSKGRLREDALLFVLVMELTSQLDRLELKDEAYWNAAHEEIGESEAVGKPKGGWVERRTVSHVGDGADVPARQVGIEGGGVVERCARRDGSERRQGVHSASQREARQRDALPYMLVTELTFHNDKSELKEEAWLNAAREERQTKIAC